jgi:hypothetical protein
VQAGGDDGVLYGGGGGHGFSPLAAAARTMARRVAA